VAVKSSGDISADPVRGQKIEEHVTDLMHITMTVGLV